MQGAGGGRWEEECLNLCTPREGFVETLRQYVEVDVFGPCYQDSQQCGKESAGDCWDLLASRCMVQTFILSSCHVMLLLQVQVLPLPGELPVHGLCHREVLGAAAERHRPCCARYQIVRSTS